MVVWADLLEIIIRYTGSTYTVSPSNSHSWLEQILMGSVEGNIQCIPGLTSDECVAQSELKIAYSAYKVVNLIKHHAK